MQKIILISWKHPLITVDCKMTGIMVVLFNFISNITKKIKFCPGYMF